MLNGVEETSNLLPIFVGDIGRYLQPQYCVR